MAVAVTGTSVPTLEEDLNGLVDGVGLEVLGTYCWLPLRPGGAAGENLEGTVPALARRAGLWLVLSDGGMKSGKPSWLGDSGMVSRKGVDPPLAGGPQRFGVKPSCACISRALLCEKNPSVSDSRVFSIDRPLGI